MKRTNGRHQPAVFRIRGIKSTVIYTVCATVNGGKKLEKLMTVAKTLKCLGQCILRHLTIRAASRRLAFCSGGVYPCRYRRVHPLRPPSSYRLLVHEGVTRMMSNIDLFAWAPSHFLGNTCAFLVINLLLRCLNNIWFQTILVDITVLFSH